MAVTYPHYDDYQGEWPWPNFRPVEVACRCCGELHLNSDAMDALQILREEWGKPIIINSGHRCPEHNASVGGKESSRHLKIAFDCACASKDQDAFCHAAVQAGFTGVGRYWTDRFVHLDLGPARVWREP